MTGPVAAPGMAKSGSVNSVPPDSGAPLALVRPMNVLLVAERLPVPDLDGHVDPAGDEVGAAGQPVGLGVVAGGDPDVLVDVARSPRP